MKETTSMRVWSAIAAAAFVATAVALVGACAQAASQPSLAPLLEAKEWLNGRPASAALRGKVVLVDFYTFACINCKHVQPNLRRLYREKARADLAIVSVHSPET